jgi:RHS repeat-associated protein
MTNQLDKGILQIDYNYLDLPKYIKFNQSVVSRGGARYVNTTYIYDAGGNKLRKDYQYKDGNNEYLASKTTDYLDGFQYEVNSTLANPMAVYILKFVPTSEGYYNFENNKYIYNYTDHLGNVRLSYTKNGSGTEIIEESNYYPFGLKHQGYNQTQGNPSYKYQYNGKEIQEETGWSDFGARMYMSDIGRWGVIDPLAETSRRFTPYNYAYNNPISFIDPDGRKAMAIDESWSWNTPVDSGWFTMGSSRRKFGSLDEFVEMTSSNEREKGGGGGGTIGESITYNEALAILGLTPGGVDFSQFDFSQIDEDPPGNALSRFRERTSNWVQENIREPLSGWFDNNTRNIFTLDAAGQARMDDLRSQMSLHMRTKVGGAIKWGAEHGLAGSGMGTGHVGAFSRLDEMFISTPYGKAFQSVIKSAVSARKQVSGGVPLYRIGTLGRSQASEAQFWSLENPLANVAAYAKKYGIPIENIKNADFIEIGVLKKGMKFITRPAPAAPGSPIGSGGGIEIVTPAHGVKLQSFSTLRIH